MVVLVAACFASTYAAYSGYSGPQAAPVVNPNGFLADTPEVAAAKAAHFSEVAKVSSPPSGYAPGPYNGAPAYNSAPAPSYNSAPAYHSAPAPSYNSYNPPAPAPVYEQHAGSHYANPSVTPQGYLADTPDVAAAKAAHFAEVAKTKSGPSSYGSEDYDDGSYKPEKYETPSYNAPAPAPAYSSYSAPAPAPAYPSYNAPAPAHHGYSAPAPPAYNSYSAPAHHGYSAPSPTGGYTGPLAKPEVTPQGFLADTPEVAAAKAAHFSEVAKVGSHPAPAPSHGHRYRRSAVLVQTPASTAPLVAYVAAPYTYPYLHAPAGYAYSVRTW